MYWVFFTLVVVASGYIAGLLHQGPIWSFLFGAIVGLSFRVIMIAVSHRK